MTRSKNLQRLALALLGVGAVATIVACGGGSGAGREEPLRLDAPAVRWLPESVKTSVHAGEVSTAVVTLSVARETGPTTISVTPELSPYVSVSPTQLPSLSPGQVQQVLLTFSSPLTALPVSLDGTIQVRDAAGVVAKPLPLILGITWPQATKFYDGVSSSYPPTLEASFESQTNTLVLKARSDFSIYQDDVFRGVSISVDTNPSNLSLSTYYDGLNGDDLGSIREAFLIGVNSAYKFIPPNTLGGDIVVVIPRADGSFVRVVDYGGAFQSNGVFSEIIQRISLGR